MEPVFQRHVDSPESQPENDVPIPQEKHDVVILRCNMHLPVVPSNAGDAVPNMEHLQFLEQRTKRSVQPARPSQRAWQINVHVYATPSRSQSTAPLDCMDSAGDHTPTNGMRSRPI